MSVEFDKKLLAKLNEVSENDCIQAADAVQLFPGQPELHTCMTYRHALAHLFPHLDLNCERTWEAVWCELETS